MKGTGCSISGCQKHTSSNLSCLRFDSRRAVRGPAS
ncbi:hypothetical protein NC653_006698 [Populus alba x Populus x berolinensis]|uniref:Uncharacterized protein n=1 Tax=Populus alba x Populus x berolinensis TaxID=444605 RepID=A0AAD6WEP5_9ROSI|nr:hypothetical protein NC653_006698 [Populus alba x Populus x berolinensis]